MSLAKIEDGCALLGTVSGDDDFRAVEISVVDLHGRLSSVVLRLDAGYYLDGKRFPDEGPQQLADRVADVLRALVVRGWEVGLRRVEKGEPSL